MTDAQTVANDRLKSQPVVASCRRCESTAPHRWRTSGSRPRRQRRPRPAQPTTTARKPARLAATPRARLLALTAGADLQHLGAGHAFRIRQIGIGHQRAAQRDGVHHAEDAAERADREDIQKGNPVHQPTMTRPGSTKMIDDSVPAAEATVCTMLFSWIVAVAEPPQHRHGDHGGRNRGGEGQAGLEAEVDVGRRERRRDHDPQRQAAQAQFGTELGGDGIGMVTRKGGYFFGAVGGF